MEPANAVERRHEPGEPSSDCALAGISSCGCLVRSCEGSVSIFVRRYWGSIVSPPTSQRWVRQLIQACRPTPVRLNDQRGKRYVACNLAWRHCCPHDPAGRLPGHVRAQRRGYGRSSLPTQSTHSHRGRSPASPRGAYPPTTRALHPSRLPGSGATLTQSTLARAYAAGQAKARDSRTNALDQLAMRSSVMCCRTCVTRIEMHLNSRSAPDAWKGGGAPNNCGRKWPGYILAGTRPHWLIQTRASTNIGRSHEADSMFFTVLCTGCGNGQSQRFRRRAP